MDALERLQWDRMRAGMTLLDARGPADWVNRLDLNLLCISSAHHCVLGQLYGSYSAGCEALDLLLGQGISYGFAGTTTDVWREALLRRRTAEPVAEPVAESEPELVAV